MTRILYGVLGEGSGHSSRAKEIISYMENKGCFVKVVSSNKGYENLSPFFDVEKIFGPGFFCKNNRIQYLLTILMNIIRLPYALKSTYDVYKISNKFKPQIVFSDFEPISGIIANIKGIPLISIDNQHRLTNTNIEYPNGYRKELWAAKIITLIMLFKAKVHLIVSFHLSKPINKRSFVFPPILRNEIFKLTTGNKEYILVYISRSFGDLINILKTVNKKFVVYGLNKNIKKNNIEFKKFSQEGFLKDLANCEGVIATAGFTLISESLYLGKPYLAIPLSGQFEQILNAYHLQKLGYGKCCHKPNKELIESFLYKLDLYKNNLKKYKKSDNSQILQKIDEIIEQYSI